MCVIHLMLHQLDNDFYSIKNAVLFEIYLKLIGYCELFMKQVTYVIAAPHFFLT